MSGPASAGPVATFRRTLTKRLAILGDFPFIRKAPNDGTKVLEAMLRQHGAEDELLDKERNADSADETKSYGITVHDRTGRKHSAVLICQAFRGRQRSWKLIGLQDWMKEAGACAGTVVDLDYQADGRFTLEVVRQLGDIFAAGKQPLPDQQPQQPQPSSAGASLAAATNRSPRKRERQSANGSGQVSNRTAPPVGTATLAAADGAGSGAGSRAGSGAGPSAAAPPPAVDPVSGLPRIAMVTLRTKNIVDGFLYFGNHHGRRLFTPLAEKYGTGCNVQVRVAVAPHGAPQYCALYSDITKGKARGGAPAAPHAPPTPPAAPSDLTGVAWRLKGVRWYMWLARPREGDLLRVWVDPGDAALLYLELERALRPAQDGAAAAAGTSAGTSAGAADVGGGSHWDSFSSGRDGGMGPGAAGSGDAALAGGGEHGDGEVFVGTRDDEEGEEDLVRVSEGDWSSSSSSLLTSSSSSSSSSGDEGVADLGGLDPMDLSSSSSDDDSSSSSDDVSSSSRDDSSGDSSDVHDDDSSSGGREAEGGDRDEGGTGREDGDGAAGGSNPAIRTRFPKRRRKPPAVAVASAAVPSNGGGRGVRRGRSTEEGAAAGSPSGNGGVGNGGGGSGGAGNRGDGSGGGAQQRQPHRQRSPAWDPLFGKKLAPTDLNDYIQITKPMASGDGVFAALQGTQSNRDLSILVGGRVVECTLHHLLRAKPSPRMTGLQAVIDRMKIAVGDVIVYEPDAGSAINQRYHIHFFRPDLNAPRGLKLLEPLSPAELDELDANPPYERVRKAQRKSRFEAAAAAAAAAAAGNGGSEAPADGPVVQGQEGAARPPPPAAAAAAARRPAKMARRGGDSERLPERRSGTGSAAADLPPLLARAPPVAAGGQGDRLGAAGVLVKQEPGDPAPDWQVPGRGFGGSAGRPSGSRGGGGDGGGGLAANSAERLARGGPGSGEWRGPATGDTASAAGVQSPPPLQPTVTAAAAVPTSPPLSRIASLGGAAGPVLPAASIQHPHGCLPAGVSPPAVREGEVRVCGLTFHPDLRPAVQRILAAGRAGLQQLCEDPAKQQVHIIGVDPPPAGATDAAAAAAALPPPWVVAFRRCGLSRNIVANRVARLLRLYDGEAEGSEKKGLPAECPAWLPGLELCGDRERGGAGLQVKERETRKGGSAASPPSQTGNVPAIKKNAVLGIVRGYVLPAAKQLHGLDLRAAAPELRAQLQQRMNDAVEGGGACMETTWKFLVRSFMVPYVWSNGAPAAPTAAGGSTSSPEGSPPPPPPPAVLSMLGYGNEAALINDPRVNPRAWVEDGNDVDSQAASERANVVVLPISVRGLVLPVVVALRDLAPGEQLFRDYGAEWWHRLAEPWEVAEDDGLTAQDVFWGAAAGGHAAAPPIDPHTPSAANPATPVQEGRAVGHGAAAAPVRPDGCTGSSQQPPLPRQPTSCPAGGRPAWRDTAAATATELAEAGGVAAGLPAESSDGGAPGMSEERPGRRRQRHPPSHLEGRPSREGASQGQGREWSREGEREDASSEGRRVWEDTGRRERSEGRSDPDPEGVRREARGEADWYRRQRPTGQFYDRDGGRDREWNGDAASDDTPARRECKAGRWRGEDADEEEAWRGTGWEGPGRPPPVGRNGWREHRDERGDPYRHRRGGGSGGRDCSSRSRSPPGRPLPPQPHARYDIFDRRDGGGGERQGPLSGVPLQPDAVPGSPPVWPWGYGPPPGQRSFTGRTPRAPAPGPPMRMGPPAPEPRIPAAVNTVSGQQASRLGWRDLKLPGDL